MSMGSAKRRLFWFSLARETDRVAEGIGERLSRVVVSNALWSQLGEEQCPTTRST